MQQLYREVCIRKEFFYWKHVCEHASSLLLTHTLEIYVTPCYGPSHTSAVSCWHITQCSGDNYNMERSLHICLVNVVNAVFMVDYIEKNCIQSIQCCISRRSKTAKIKCYKL